MNFYTEEVIIKGKILKIHVYLLNNKKMLITGSFLKIVRIKEEWDEDIENPELLIFELKNSGIDADIFTFIQRIPYSKPKFDFYMEWENVAAIPIKNFDYWWKNQINKTARNKLRKSQKDGVVVKLVEFNEELIQGISNIYNETPIRQGRPFWNYGTDYEFARKENAPFLDRADFLGAYYMNELIGFIRLVYTERFARTMGILAKIKYRDKAPMNALLVEAVKICARKKIPFLIYAKYQYGKLGSDSLRDFKRHNGFESIILPRYYIPLTRKGTIALKLNLHHKFYEIMPQKALQLMRNFRNKWYEKKLNTN